MGIRSGIEQGGKLIAALVVLVVLVSWALASSLRFVRDSKLAVEHPVVVCTQLSYNNGRLALFFDDSSDRLFGIEHLASLKWGKERSGPRGRGMTPLPSGLGVDFGASPATVQRRFGPPTSIVRSHQRMLAYAYWSQSRGKLLLEQGYMLFRFWDEQLMYVSAFFKPFSLPQSVKYGMPESAVIAAYGPAESVISRTRPRLEMVPAVPPLPPVIPVASWSIAGLAAMVLTWLLGRSGAVRRSLAWQIFASGCVGSVCCVIGLTGVLLANGEWPGAVIVPAARVTMPVGFGMGAMFGWLLWPGLGSAGRTRILLRTAGFLLGGAAWTLAVLVILAKVGWLSLAGADLLVLFFSLFGLAWAAWRWILPAGAPSAVAKAPGDDAP